MNLQYSEACDGKQAINLILKQDKIGKPYKIIIMDCNMPVIDGWEATKRLKTLYEDRVLKRYPNIIGYSAFNGEEERKKSLDCGMVQHLVKPSPPEIIMATVRNHLF